MATIESTQNILILNTSWTRRDKGIIYTKIQNEVDGKSISRVEKIKIYNSSARKFQRHFNCIPGKIRNLTGFTSDTFKSHLDEWLKKVPDQPRGGGYSVAAESNGIQHQAVVLRTRR